MNNPVSNISDQETTLTIDLSQNQVQTLLALLNSSDEVTLEQEIQHQLLAQGFQKDIPREAMTYSRFKSIKMVEEIHQKLFERADDTLPSIKTIIKGEKLLNEPPSKKPSGWLLEMIALNKKTPLISEKSRSEGLIRPILLELVRANPDRFTLFSGETFEVDARYGLTGECDFLLSLSLEKDFIQSPIFALVEAKKKSIEEGLGQCAAQMIAARELNDKEGKSLPAIFGAVSTGEAWRFLKLEASVLLIDSEKYFEKFELDKILGMLQYVLDFYE